jgi:hypothetical protein
LAPRRRLRCLRQTHFELLLLLLLLLLLQYDTREVVEVGIASEAVSSGRAFMIRAEGLSVQIVLIPVAVVTAFPAPQQ